MTRFTKLVALAVLGLGLIGGGRVNAGSGPYAPIINGPNNGAVGGGGGFSDPLAYSNGPINGTLDAWTINLGYSVSDSFTVSANTSLTSASGVGLWVEPGDAPVATGWSIGTSPFASDVSSGSSSLTSTLVGYGYGYYPIYASILALSGEVMSGTTYWFTLYNAQSAASNAVYWDINNGPSVAYENTIGNVNGVLFPGSNSTSFQLNGVSVPEPSSMVLGVLGAIGGLGTMYARRRRIRTTA